jgi:hypothetical protein
MPISTSWITTTQLTATLDFSTAALGFWTAVVTHSATISDALPNALLVAFDRIYLPLASMTDSP